MRVEEVVVRRLVLPLVRPYLLSYRTFTEFEPILVEVRMDDGRHGFGEGHISPGSSSETRDGGWAFCRAQAEAIIGKSTDEAKAAIEAKLASSRVAATALITAIEMAEGHPVLKVPVASRLPLLAPFNALLGEDIVREVEQKLDEGFRTFKIKVGKDARADLERVAAIQRAIANRARLRLDANRAYSESDACWFASRLDPSSVELFEQPCAAEDWPANAHVAKVSNVPVMLDEPISSLCDIERAAAITNVRFLKLKLKRFGSLERLHRALDHVRRLGMEPVLGDGLSGEIGCWMEACVARHTIRNAGEFNGFLKPKARLFSLPLGFEAGALMLPAGFSPSLDRKAVEKHQTACERFAVRAVAPPI